MVTNAENHQGRARGLYDEQLQRQKQEKLHRAHHAPHGELGETRVPTPGPEQA